MKLVIRLCLAGVFLYGHCPLCPAWVALAPGGVNWIQRCWEGICGLGAHRLPSKSARVWAVSCHPLSLFQEQERVCVSGAVRFPGLLWVPLGSQQLWGCDLTGSSQGCGTQCVACTGISREDLWAPVPPSRLGPSRGLSPDLTASLPFPPSSMWTVLYSPGVDKAFCWCHVFSGDGTLMCSWGSWAQHPTRSSSPGQCVTLTVC